MTPRDANYLYAILVDIIGIYPVFLDYKKETITEYTKTNN